MANTGQDEVLLIEKIREGKEYAFEIVFLKYYEKMCKYVWKYVRSEALAEDIVQEVFADIWKNRNDLDPDGHLKGLLFTSSRNKALDYIKHQKIVDKYEDEVKRKEEQQQSPAAKPQGANELVFSKKTRKAIDDLPPKAKQVFLLNRKEGLTYKEIAKYLGISVKTVESQISRALKILRKRLSYLSINS